MVLTLVENLPNGSDSGRKSAKWFSVMTLLVLGRVDAERAQPVLLEHRAVVAQGLDLLLVLQRLVAAVLHAGQRHLVGQKVGASHDVPVVSGGQHDTLRHSQCHPMAIYGSGGDRTQSFCGQSEILYPDSFCQNGCGVC